MKRIRIDYYYYRLKKGRADVLLQRVEDSDVLCIPFHYVQADEMLPNGTDGYRTEDDGDLVLIHCSLNDAHLNMKGRQWQSLDQLYGVRLQRNEQFHIYHNIFSFALKYCHPKGEAGLMRRLSDYLETVKIEAAKKDYVERLQRVLDGEELTRPYCGVVKQPDPDLIRNEIETLEHFRLHKPPHIPINVFDAALESKNLYSYKPIDWTALGSEFRSDSQTLDQQEPSV